jgi:hypothetical protein
MIPLQKDCGQYVWWHYTPRVILSHEDRFIIGYRVGRERRRIYARARRATERRAIARLLAAYGR